LGYLALMASTESKKEQARAYHRAYRAKHYEKRLAYDRAYRAAHLEQVKATINRWHRAHRENVRINSKRWRDAHKEQHAAANARWKKANPARRLLAEQKRRAAKLASPGGGLSLEQWEAVDAACGGKCAYCLRDDKMTMDHVVPLSRGVAHDVANIVAACISCNASKGNRLVSEWRR